jgi:hypothetical protein
MAAVDIAITWLALASVAFLALTSLARVAARRDALADHPLPGSFELRPVLGEDPAYAGTRWSPIHELSHLS